MRCPNPSAVSFPLGVLVLAAAGLAPLSSFSTGCANGTSAVSVGVDAGSSQPGDDDDINQPLPGDDDANPTGDSGASTDAGEASRDGAAAADGSSDAATGDSGPSPTTCAGQLALAQYSFDTGAQGWTHGISDGQTDPSWPFDPWTQGTAASGTPACPSGSCFGAELTENYAQCQRGYLESPAINVSACAGQPLTLTFQHSYSFWNDGTYFDGGVIFVSADGGANWHTLDGSNTFPAVVSIQPTLDGYSCDPGGFEVDGKAGYAGVSAGVVSAQLVIPATLVTSQLLIKFSMGSGVSSADADPATSRKYTSSGWRVDNVGLQLP
jgi:hypothetical protein